MKEGDRVTFFLNGKIKSGIVNLFLGNNLYIVKVGSDLETFHENELKGADDGAGEPEQRRAEKVGD